MKSEKLYTYLRLHFLPDPKMSGLPQTHTEQLITDHDKALNLIDETLRSVIEEQAKNLDGEWGSFLSGGIDSSLVCSYLKDIKPNMEVFSIGNDSSVHDETALATEYARLMGLKQHLVKMDSDVALHFLDYLDQAITEPFGDFSLIPTTFVAKMAKEAGMASCFSGDGGDELFFGYPRYWSVAKNIKYQHLPFGIKKLLYGIDKVFFKNRHINAVVLCDKQAEAHLGLHSRFSDEEVKKLCPDIEAHYPEWFDVFNYPNYRDEQELLIHMREVEFKFMGDKGLRKLKLASEVTGLNIVTPMLHPRFIEAALRVSPYLSYGDGKKKQLLKDLLAKRVPGAPIDNQKRGFTMPLGKWIREELREPFTQTLSDKETIEFFGMDKNVMTEILKAHLDGKKDYKHALFTLYTLFRWHQHEREN